MSDTGTVEVRLYGDLADVAGGGTDSTVRLELTERRSVKDLVESLGVPHPEVGLLVVDGEPVGFDHVVPPAERVAVYPPFTTIDVGAADLHTAPRPPRFVLDVHLGRLARRLRTLGFDAWYRPDADDAELAGRATAESRVLLTRDRGLLKRRVVEHGYCPRSDDPDEQLREVVRRYGLAEHAAPYSRCARCNAPVEPVAKAEVLEQLPPATRREHDRFTRCTGCGQVYWPGTHLDRLGPLVAGALDVEQPPDRP